MAIGCLNNVFNQNSENNRVSLGLNDLSMQKKSGSSHQSNCDLDKSPNLALSDGCHAYGMHMVCNNTQGNVVTLAWDYKSYMNTNREHECDVLVVGVALRACRWLYVSQTTVK